MEINKTIENSLQPEFVAQNIAAARNLSGKTIKECSSLLGVPTSRLKSYESGKYIPSLPELESLSFLLRIPLVSFFRENGVSNFIPRPDKERLIKLIGIRQQIIGTKIHLFREAANMSLKKLAKQTAVPVGRLKRYEEGITAIPLDTLQLILEALELKPDEFLDRESPIGDWQNSQSESFAVKQLPEDIRKFITNLDNLNFLLIAQEISKIGVQKLHDFSSALSNFINSIEHLE